MAQLFANAARSTLTASITASATQLQINPADQGLFPVASGTDWFKVAVEDSSGNIEYIKVQRAVGSPLMTVMSGGRAVEDSAKFPARSFNAGSLVELRMTAADLALSIAHPSAGTNAHAATAIAFTPVKTLAAANVQAAIEELLTEGGLDTLALQGDAPQITFDAGDYLLFNRDTNLLNVVIGGAGRFYVDASGPARETDATTANGLVRKSQLDGALSPFSGGLFHFDAASAPAGFIEARGDQTIGNASSGATRANADTWGLYQRWWASPSQAIYTSSGSAATRGASALDDFNAGKRIQVREARSEWVRGADRGRGVYAGNVGEYLDQMLPDHTHPVTPRDDERLAGGVAGGSSFAYSDVQTGGAVLASGVSGSVGTENRVRSIVLLACWKL